MARGDVHLVGIEFPTRPGDAGGLRQKYVVVLQSGPTFVNCTDVAVVVCSTLRHNNPMRPFEVKVGQTEGFDHDTVIDCRWPRTILKSLPGMAYPMFTLPVSIMDDISEALVVGLQL